MNKLILKKTLNEGLKEGIKRDGKSYSVRDDRSRYFFPNEWIQFYNALKKDKRPIFDTLINTGARIEEALNIRSKDFDYERNTLTLVVTKRKAKLNENVGKKRTFKISSQYAKRMNKYIINQKKLNQEPLFDVSKQSVWSMMRRILKKIQIKDWYNFSLHNIRKTHGNWLKALEVPPEEICLRLGHDYNTYLKHYGSATIFDRKDKLEMINILGDIYGIK